MAEITDPNLLAQLNNDQSPAVAPVTDPALLAQLEGQGPQPSSVPTVPVSGPDTGLAATAAPRTGFDRLIDAYKESVQTGIPGILARNTEIAMGNAPDQVEAAQRELRQSSDALANKDNWYDPNNPLSSTLEKGFPTLLGHLVGNPENLIGGGGEGLVARALRQGAVSGGTNVGTQLADIGQNVQDKFNEGEALASAASGAGLSALHSIGSAAWSKLFPDSSAPVLETGPHAQGGKDVLPDGSVGVPGAHLSPDEFRQNLVDTISEKNADGSYKNNAQDIKDWVAQQGADPDKISNLDKTLEARDKGQPFGVQVPGAEGIQPHTAVSPAPVAEPVTPAQKLEDNVVAARAAHDDNVQKFDEAYSAGRSLDRDSPEYQEWVKKIQPLSAAVDESNKALQDAADAHDSFVNTPDKGVQTEGVTPPEKFPQAVEKPLPDGTFASDNPRETAATGSEGEAQASSEAPPLTGEDRRAAIKDATQKLNDQSAPGKTAIVQPFPDNEPDYYRFQHTTTDGKTVSGIYTYDPDTGIVDNFSIGSKVGKNGVGPSAVRGILNDIKANHPELRGIEGYRISGARSDAPKFIKAGIDNGTGTDVLPTGDNDSVKPPVATARPIDGQEPSSKTASPEEGTNTVEDRLTEQLKTAGKVREEQAKLYTEERKARLKEMGKARDTTSGEEGYRSELATLKGELPKADFTNSHDFTQEDIDGLFDKVKNDPKLRLFESITARRGLAKILEGNLPQPSELEQLKKVFSPDFIKTVMKSREDMAKFSGQKEMFSGEEMTSTGPMKTLLPEEKPVDPDKFVRAKGQGDLFETPAKPTPPKNPKTIPSPARQIAANILNIPRALMSSFDLSAPLRQGVFMVGRKEFYKALPDMVKAFGSQRVYDGIMSDIESRPTYKLMQDSNLALTENGADLNHREESFISNYAEKIPLIGRGIKASERAYVGFLNKIRADSFDSIIKNYKDAGIDLTADKDQINGISRYINSATGRGDLGRLNGATPLLNSLFFSPRLIKSRVDMLNPQYYASLPPVARKEAIKSLLSFGAIATTTLGLAKAAGLGVEVDPRSSDFGKIKVGNTRYDILGGFAQYLTLGARLATNEKKNAQGDISELGKKYGAPTRLDTAVNFGINKESPVASFITDYLRGKDPTGMKFDLKNEIGSRFVPLLIQDINDIRNDRGLAEAIPMAIPGVFGVGLQTYPPTEAKKKVSWQGKEVTLQGDKVKELSDKTDSHFNDLSSKVQSAPLFHSAPEQVQKNILKSLHRSAHERALVDVMTNAPVVTDPNLLKQLNAGN